MEVDKPKIARSARWTVVSKMIGQLISFATTLILVRLLDKADFGLFAMALLYIWLIDCLADSGFLSAIIQRRTIDNMELSSCFWLLLVIATVIIIASQFAAPGVAWLFQEPRVTHILRTLSWTFLVLPLTVICTGLLSRELRLDTIASTELGVGAIRATLAMALAYAGYGVMSLVYGYVVERIALGLALAVRSRWRPSPACNLRKVWPLMTFGMGVTVGRLLWFGFTKLDTLIIGRLLGAEVLGVYGIASQIAMAFAQFISSACYRVIYPVLSRHQDSARFDTLVIHSSVCLAVVALPVLAGIAGIAPDIVEMFLGADWHDAVVPLAVLAIVAALQTISGLLPQAINARGHSEVGAWTNLLSLLVFGVGFYFAADVYGLAGVLAVWLFLFPLRYVAIVLSARVIIGLSAKAYLRAHLGTLAATVTMIVAVLATRELAAALPLGPRLLLSVVIGAAVYLASAFFVVRGPFLDLWRLLQPSPRVAS